MKYGEDQIPKAVRRERRRLEKARAGGMVTGVSEEAERLQKERERLRRINAGEGPLAESIRRRSKRQGWTGP